MSREVGRRVFLSAAIPIGAAVFVAVLLWAFSRVLLAVDKDIAPLVSLLFAMNILVGCALAAILRGRRSFAFVVGVMIAVVLAAGVAAAFVGEQPHHRLASAGPGEHGPGAVPPAEPTAEPTGEPTMEPTEQPTGEPTDEPAGEPVQVAAEGLAFDTETIELPAETAAVIEFDNRDQGQSHNISIYTEEGGEALFSGEVVVAPTVIDYTVEPLPAGEYYFQCDVHPTMNGTVVVR